MHRHLVARVVHPTGLAFEVEIDDRGEDGYDIEYVTQEGSDEEVDTPRIMVLDKKGYVHLNTWIEEYVSSHWREIEDANEGGEP